MKIEALSRPFDQTLIKQKPGPRGSGITYPYVVGRHYIERLNEAFEYGWSFEVVEHHASEKEVIVLGKLTTPLGVKQQFGGQRLDERHELSDGYKGAVTDALKKCASLLGIGLHIQDDDESDSGYAPPRTSTGTSAGASRPAAAPADNPASPASARQLDAIEAIAKSKGMSSDELDSNTRKMFGRGWEQLSKAQASKVISWLKGDAPGAGDSKPTTGGGGGDAPPPIGDEDLPF